MRLFSSSLAVFFILALTDPASAQIQVTGSVRTATGEKLPGVSVKIKGTQTAAVTDENGFYKISVQSGAATLVFTYLGFQPKEETVRNRPVLNVTIAENTNALNEVVVVGYAQQSRSKTTAAISKLDTKELTGSPNPNPVQAIQGKIAGVSVPVTAGQPGAGAPNIIIRGGTKPNVYGSGLGNNNGNPVAGADGSSPLVVVDGVFRSLNDIDPNNIESFQVMKDAASTAIYGARGANGVIVIKTKTGKTGTKPVITLDHRTTWETQARRYDYLSATDYLRLARTTVANTSDLIDKNVLLNNGGFSAGTRVYNRKGDYGKNIYLTALYDNIVQVEGQAYVDNLLSRGWMTMSDPLNPGTRLLYADNRYQDEIWKTGLSSYDNVGMSGGSEKSDYNLSMGYTNQNGVFVGTRYQRYDALGNFGFRASDNFRIDASLNYQNVMPNYVDGFQNELVRGVRVTPLIRTFKDDGNPMPGELYTVRNRFHTIRYDDVRQTTERLISRLAGDLTIIRGLHFKPSLSYVINDYSELFRRKGTPADEIQPATQRQKNDYTNNSRQLMIDQVLQYDFSLQNRHNFTTLAGINFTRNKEHITDFGSQRGANDYVYTIDEPATTTIGGTVFSNVTIFRARLNENRSASAFGQFNYDYDGKYLLGGSLRYDGFSNFAPQNKYAFFPSVSAGWNVHREKFWHVKPLSTFKLRGSWGAAGLNDLNITDTYGGYAAANYGQVTGIARNNLANPNLRWETTQTLDLAFDAGFFNNRITLTVDYYNKLTKDRLTVKPLPSESPFASILYNNGALRNRGVEVELGGALVRAGKFTWNTNFSFAYNQQLITALPANNRLRNRQGGDLVWDENMGQLAEAGGFAEGERPYAIYAYNVLGVFSTDAEAAAWNAATKDNLASPNGIRVGKKAGDFIFEDRNKDGVIDTRDQMFMGYRNPDKIGGMQNTFTFKNISLRLAMDYALGHIISNGNLARSLGQGRAFNEGAPAEALGPDIWQKSGDSGKKYARFSFADADFGQRNYLRSATLGVNNSYGSDISAMYEKGDFLAFRELTLTYSLPQKITDKIKSKGLNIYASVFNLGYLTKYQGLNPEIYTGFDPGGYPRPRQFSLGATLKF